MIRVEHTEVTVGIHVYVDTKLVKLIAIIKFTNKQDTR